MCFTGTGLAVSPSCQLEPLLEAPVILQGLAGSTVVPLRHSPAVIMRRRQQGKSVAVHSMDRFGQVP